MKTHLIILLNLLLAAGAYAAPFEKPDLPNIPKKTFKLADFGAVPDDGMDDTAAFYKAFAAVEKAGGGHLMIGSGIYNTGQLTLISKFNLHLEKGATLLFSGDPAAYQIEGAAARKFKPLISADDVTDLAITGEGIIDGNGMCWWEEAREFKYAARARGEREEIGRPRLMILEDSERIYVEGITLRNSPQITFIPKRCVNVTIKSVKVESPEDAPNTDGIDPAGSRRVWISGCVIDTGDDNIAIKSGDDEFGSIADMLIEDCTFRKGHGMSIGSETYGEVHNLIVRNCTFDGTDAGVRMKSARGKGGVVENVLYENLKMRKVKKAISINSYYPERNTPEIGTEDEKQPEERGPRTPVWRNIVIRNVESVEGRKSAGEIVGLPEAAVSNIRMENVKIEAPTGLRLREVEGLYLRNVELTVEKGKKWLLEPGEKEPKVY